MASRLDIINLALARIRAPRIASLDEENLQSRIAALTWDTALDATLRLAEWGFASKEERLALLPKKPLGSVFAYAVPADCVAIRRVLAADDIGRNLPTAPYSVKNFNNRPAILCDVADAAIDYTARINNCELYDAQFTDALAWRLSADFALALKVDPELASAAVQMSDRERGEAGTANARESGQDDDEVSSFERARWS